MNTLMYEHPLTAEHLRIVQDVVKYEIVGPIGKALACGDVGAFSLRPCFTPDHSNYLLTRHGCNDRVAGHRPNSRGQVRAYQGIEPESTQMYFLCIDSINVNSTDVLYDDVCIALITNQIENCV